MKKKNGRDRPSEKEMVPREVEGPSTAPGPDEVENSAVGGHDSGRAGYLQSELGEGGADRFVGSTERSLDITDGGEGDLWLETMKDLARLVLAAYEADPHRFDDLR